MSDKSDDIKQLFSHLGLNPSDYQEIRSAPSASATVSEAPRRWSLLQATSRQPLPTKVAPILNSSQSVAPAAVPVASGTKMPLQGTGGLPPSIAVASSPAAAQGLAPVSSTASDHTLAEGLRSLFQSVREPVHLAPAVSTPSAAVSPPDHSAADQVYRELRSSVAPQASLPPEPLPAWSGYDAEQETRYAIPPSPQKASDAPPLAPAPVPQSAAKAPTMKAPVMKEPVRNEAPMAPKSPAVVRPQAPVDLPPAMPEPGSHLQAAFRRLAEPEPPRAAASGRLRLRTHATPQVQANSNREARLDDVLRRISGHNGPSK